MCIPNNTSNQNTRGEKGFGSTGHAILFTQRLNDRPKMSISLSCGNHTVSISPILDTGADVTIVSEKKWPQHWPLQAPTGQVLGVGGVKAPKLSSYPIVFQFAEGQKATLRPYVMSLPADLNGLLGRDILSQLGVVLTTEKKF